MEGKVSNHLGVRNNTNEEVKRMKFGQSDERTIYEVQHGTQPIHGDYCSITIEDGGGLDNEMLQQRIHSVYRQREDLHNMEIELRAHIMARSAIVEMKNSFDVQIKEHVNAYEELKQLEERESIIHELELQMEEKDRELRAITIDNEAAWAKEDLLREQNKELASFRREFDNSEAERAQNLKQIHDLKEYSQEKERQIRELEDQHRVAQEAIAYKDEQLRDAQTWIQRAQEMDALQSTANHSLQAELRERTDQFNQFWVGCQRQFADVEMHHLQTIQQLKLELAEARERSGTSVSESCVGHAQSKDASLQGEDKGNHFNVNAGGVSGNSEVLMNGDTNNALSKTEQLGVSVISPSLVGMGAYLPNGHVSAVHPFVMHQQGIPQLQMEHCQPIPSIVSHKHWQNHQVVSEGLHVPNQNPYQPAGQSISLGVHYDNNFLSNGLVLYPDRLEAQISSSKEPNTLKSSEAAQPAEQFLQGESSENQDALALEPLEQITGTKGRNEKTDTVSSDSHEGPLPVEQPRVLHPDANLLDERSLLVCLVRAIPAGSGGRIKISSTLSNRLGKMLVPFHWHDYKKIYGKLDDCLRSHPELFVVEGDFIHLREGAQEIISATTVLAKVAAAAAVASPSYSSSFTSIAVTPMAQNLRLKKPYANFSSEASKV
ncbi:hypothetical protein MKX01_041174 [Papaver californicum]|nr:hypothetical protein MKX01_041174 [Papaver californicum]